MKFLKNLLIFVILLVILALINRWYLGGFTQLTPKEQTMGPYTIAYVNFTGEYGKVGPSMDKVYEALSGAGIVSTMGVGIYYDDPAVVSGANLRSDVGAIIDIKDVSTLVKINEIKTKIIPEANRIMVEFPIKNSLSYVIGPMKVYPVMAKYMKEKGYTTQSPMIELYDMTAKKIYYMADISK